MATSPLTISGVLAPAGTPAEVVDRLNAEINKSLKKAETVARIQAMGFESVVTTPAQLGQRLRDEYRSFGQLIVKTGISAQ